jgi:hypothetical protein
MALLQSPATDGDQVGDGSLRPLTPAQRAIFFSFAAAFLYLNLFLFSGTPFWGGVDQHMFILGAMRMRDGEVIYRDFFQFLFPGTETVFLAFLKVFGLRAWIPNLLLLFLGLGLVWTLVKVAEKVVSSKGALLAGLLFLTTVYRTELDASNHWFSTLAIMLALMTVMDRRSRPRWIAAGALCGVSSFFNSAEGVFAILGFTAFLFWETRDKRKEWRDFRASNAWLFGSFLATVAALNSYFIWKAGWNRFFWCTVVFVLKYYHELQGANGPSVYMSDIAFGSPSFREVFKLGIILFVYVLVPFTYLLFVLAYRREKKLRPAFNASGLVLLNCLGLFLALGILPAPSRFRLCGVSPPAFIILAWLVDSRRRLDRALRALLWLAALCLAILEPLGRQVAWRGIVESPTGRVAVPSPDEWDKYSWLARHTHPGEYIFETFDSDVYVMFDLRDPGEVPWLSPDAYTRPEQVLNMVSGLERHHVQLILWTTYLDLDPANTPGDSLAPLRAYLHQHYHPVKYFPDLYEAWVRDEPPPRPRAEPGGGFVSPGRISAGSPPTPRRERAPPRASRH